MKRVGRDDRARCFCSFFVVLACDNDTSNFSLFSSLPPCNAIFRFHAVGFRVEIENCIFLNSVQKRREADDNFEFTQYVVEEIIHAIVYVGTPVYNLSTLSTGAMCFSQAEWCAFFVYRLCYFGILMSIRNSLKFVQ